MQTSVNLGAHNDKLERKQGKHCKKKKHTFHPAVLRARNKRTILDTGRTIIQVAALTTARPSAVGPLSCCWLQFAGRRSGQLRGSVCQTTGARTTTWLRANSQERRKCMTSAFARARREISWENWTQNVHTSKYAPRLANTYAVVAGLIKHWKRAQELLSRETWDKGDGVLTSGQAGENNNNY